MMVNYWGDSMAAWDCHTQHVKLTLFALLRSFLFRPYLCVVFMQKKAVFCFHNAAQLSLKRVNNFFCQHDHHVAVVVVIVIAHSLLWR